MNFSVAQHASGSVRFSALTTHVRGAAACWGASRGGGGGRRPLRRPTRRVHQSEAAAASGRVGERTHPSGGGGRARSP